MKHHLQRSDNWLSYYTAACDWHCARTDWRGNLCQDTDGVRRKSWVLECRRGSTKTKRI